MQHPVIRIFGRSYRGLGRWKRRRCNLPRFPKAFDKVPHKRLLKKLWAYGIRGKIYSWVKYFLKGRTQSVLVDGYRSTKAKVTSGIPQGSVLGPILFLIVINDLPLVIQALKKLFADDAKIYQTVTSMAEVHSYNVL